MHGLLGTDCTQTWSFGCISPSRLELLLRRARCIASYQAPKQRMVQPDRPHRMPGDTLMHDLGSTVCTEASLCGCTRPDRANRLMLHLSAYVMHCQLPNSKASRGAVCSLSLLARGHADARPAWHRLLTDMVVWVH